MADPTLAEVVTFSDTLIGGSPFDLNLLSAGRLTEINANELVIVAYNVENGGGFDGQSAAEAQGWTYTCNERQGTTLRGIVLYKQCSGSETFVTLDTAAGSRPAQFAIWRFQDWNTVDWSAVTETQNTEHTNATITASGGAPPGGDNNAFLSVDMHGPATSPDVGFVSAPTGYTNGAVNASEGPNGSAVRINAGYRLLSAASDTPSNWVFDGVASASQRAVTVGAVVTRGTKGPSGGGGTTVSSEGVLVSGSAVIVGDFYREITTSGALASQSAVVSGAAERKITSGGALESGSATASGEGTPSGNTDSVGALISQAAAIAGLSERIITSQGVLTSQTAAVAGVSEREVVSSGTLVSGPAMIFGFGPDVDIPTGMVGFGLGISIGIKVEE